MWHDGSHAFCRNRHVRCNQDSEAVRKLFGKKGNSLGENGLEILHQYFKSLNLDLDINLSALLAGDFSQILSVPPAGTCALKLRNGESPTRPASSSRSRPRTNSQCFVAGTPVCAGDGFRSIQTIRKHQTLWSWNQETGAWQVDTVAETFQSEYSGLMVTLTVAGETIECTRPAPLPGHPRRRPGLPSVDGGTR